MSSATFRAAVGSLLVASLAVTAGCWQRSLTPPGNDSGTRNPWVDVASREIPPTHAASVESLVAGNTAFACDLYRVVARDHVGANIVLAPFSASAALAMTAEGARGATRDEMRRVLHTESLAEPAAAWRALLQSLAYGAERGPWTFAVANGMWLDRETPFESAFTTSLAAHFDATARSADFQHAFESARADINQWTNAATRGRIPEIEPAGSVNALTRFVLVNALYFKAGWLHEFLPSLTHDHWFYRTPADSTLVPMMYAPYATPQWRNALVKVARLPYLGEDLSMVCVVPSAGHTLRDVEAVMTADSLRVWIARTTSRPAYGSLYMPRFTVRLHAPLVSPLGELGMPLAFAAGADFGGISPITGLQLTDVEHEAFVAVDEHGTEAAGATAVTGGLTSIPPSVRLDQPFLFAIVDHVTGSVLFLGHVTDPSPRR